MNPTQKPPQRLLTHDEVICFPCGQHKEYPYRIRIWQGRDATPIVLASQGRDAVWYGPPAHHISETIANFVHSAILGYPSCGMIYFESEFIDKETEPRLTQVYFEYFGYAYRVRMYRPIHKQQKWAFLEYIVGGEVER